MHSKYHIWDLISQKKKEKKKERSLYYTNNFELHFIIIILHNLEMEYDFVRKDQKLPLLTGVKLYSTTLYQFPTDLLSPLFQIVGWLIFCNSSSDKNSSCISNQSILLMRSFEYMIVSTVTYSRGLVWRMLHIIRYVFVTWQA